MSDQIVAAMVSAIPPTLVGIAILVSSLRNYKSVSAIHSIVNSKATEQLRIGMVSAMALAAAVPTPENISLAKIAEEQYKEALSPVR